MIHSTTDQGLSDLPVTIERTVQDLARHMHQFDSIVTSGVSGLVVASPVAWNMGMPLVIVRDGTKTKCYHAQPVEGLRDIGRRYLFLDDHIGLGTVFEMSLRAIQRVSDAHCVATYEYEDRKFRTFDQKMEEVYHTRSIPGAQDVMRRNAMAGYH